MTHENHPHVPFCTLGQKLKSTTKQS